MCQEKILEYNLSQDIIKFASLYVNPKTLMFSDDNILISIQNVPNLLLDKVVLNVHKAELYHAIRTYDGETLQCSQLQTVTTITQTQEDKTESVTIQHKGDGVVSNIVIAAAQPKLSSLYSSLMFILSKIKITSSPLHKILLFRQLTDTQECINTFMYTNDDKLHYINIRTDKGDEAAISVLANTNDAEMTRAIIQISKSRSYTIIYSKLKNNINYIYEHFGYKTIKEIYGYIVSYTHSLFVLISCIITNDSAAALTAMCCTSAAIIFLPTLLLYILRLINRSLNKYNITNDNYGLSLRIINQGEFIWEILSTIYVITSMIGWINVITLTNKLPFFNVTLNSPESIVIFPTKYGCLTPAKILLVISITLMSEITEHYFSEQKAIQSMNVSTKIYIALLLQYVINNRILGHILLFVFIAIVNQIILLKQKRKTLNADINS